MVKLVGVFVLRQWQTADGMYRIEIVRVQDGSRVVVATFDDAVSWLRAQTMNSGPTWLEDR